MEEYERRFRIPALQGFTVDLLSPYNEDAFLHSHGLAAGETATQVVVTDRYLKGHEDAPPLRHRVTRGRGGAPATAELTAKFGKGARRQEYRWPAGLIVDGTHLGRVSKVRFQWSRVEYGRTLKFHVEYVVGPGGAGGWIAEVEGEEFPVDRFDAPKTWVEVTGNALYSNYSIATKGWPHQ